LNKETRSLLQRQMLRGCSTLCLHAKFVWRLRSDANPSIQRVRVQITRNKARHRQPPPSIAQ